jgi:TPR repeat protein
MRMCPHQNGPRPVVWQRLKAGAFAFVTCFTLVVGTGIPEKAAAQSPAGSARDLDQDGRSAYALGHYTEAVALFQKAAAQGNADAQFMMGQCFLNGQGVAQDQGQAVNWYRKAADQGYVPGQLQLANSYRTGRGVSQDHTQALAWYRKAAAQELSLAQFMIAEMYRKGQGNLKADDKIALDWFRKAANQNTFPAGYDPVADAELFRAVKAMASYITGIFYEAGLGTPVDAAQATNWFAKAAELGNEEATAKLAALHDAPVSKGGVMEFVCRMTRGTSHVSVDAGLKSVRIEAGQVLEFKDDEQQYVTITAKAIEFGCRSRKADTDIVADSLSNMFQPKKNPNPLKGLNNDLSCLTRHRIDRVTGLWIGKASGGLIGNVAETAECKLLSGG